MNICSLVIYQNPSSSNIHQVEMLRVSVNCNLADRVFFAHYFSQYNKIMTAMQSAERYELYSENY